MFCVQCIADDHAIYHVLLLSRPRTVQEPFPADVGERRRRVPRDVSRRHGRRQAQRACPYLLSPKGRRLLALVCLYAGEPAGAAPPNLNCLSGQSSSARTSRAAKSRSPATAAGSAANAQARRPRQHPIDPVRSSPRSSRRHDPNFADLYRRLSQAGKPKKLIRIALARKLLVRLNAKARNALNELAHAT